MSQRVRLLSLHRKAILDDSHVSMCARENTHKGILNRISTYLKTKYTYLFEDVRKKQAAVDLGVVLQWERQWLRVRVTNL